MDFCLTTFLIVYINRYPIKKSNVIMNPPSTAPRHTTNNSLEETYPCQMIFPKISFRNHFSSINIIAFHLQAIKGRERANGVVAKLYKRKALLGRSVQAELPRRWVTGAGFQINYLSTVSQFSLRLLRRCGAICSQRDA